MNDNQIIRIPYKYGELLNTMDNQDCGKLIKALFFKNPSNLEGLSETYYNIIIVDINNLENQVKKGQLGGKKGGRPSNKKTLGVNEIKTPPLQKQKPKISKDKIREDNINKDNINNNIVKSIDAIKIATLQELMIKFIDKESYINKGIPENIISLEMNKFYNYWIQKNAGGKKEHWQKQKTFDVARRFTTWIGNIKPTNLQPKRGTGITKI